MAPLSGIRIVEFTHFLAGPYAGLTLADMGADVIKVEDPDHADEARSMGPFDSQGESLYFRSLNWAKRSVGVRLLQPGGRQVALDLARSADAVLDNFRPGVLAKLGLAHADLSAVNPSLVTCSLTGFGETGPYADRPGYDYTIQAQSGVMSLAGEPDGPPTKAGISYVDHAGGLAAALAICAGLLESARTGVGRHIDLGLLDVQVSMLSYLAAWNLNAGVRPSRRPASAHPSLVPAQNFRTLDGHVALFVGNDSMWRRLVAVLADEELASEAYATREGRRRNAEAVCRRVQALLLRDTSASWAARLCDAGVACAPVNELDQALADPHVAARHLLSGGPGAADAFRHTRGPAVDLSSGQDRPAPRLGEHTREVLRGLGYEDCRLAELDRSGDVVGSPGRTD